MHASPITGVRPADRIRRAFDEFQQRESSGGILLLAAALLAIGWANSPWADGYTGLWSTPLAIGFGDARLAKPLVLWVNDGLMALFFFVVGLEIKREILVGELASPRRAAFPLIAALGGAVVPAAVYLALTVGTRAARGWGVPMATDIAFALGVLALLGRRVPTALKVFLTALAIADDLLAVLVIALFYSTDLSAASLLAAGGVFALMLAGNRLGVRHPVFYGVLGVALWFAFLKSGVHATVAGVVAALAIPARADVDAEEFRRASRAVLDDPRSSVSEAVYALAGLSEAAESPLQRLEHALLPWVTFFVMPVFALANAGVALGAGLPPGTGPIAAGVVLGLVAGKPLGILLAAWAATATGVATRPAGVSWSHLAGAGSLAGIGFTMSLFIADLAFDTPGLLDAAKMGILLASLVSGLLGTALLLRAGRR